jgi:outer membrane biosynthesis protein TonB
MGNAQAQWKGSPGRGLGISVSLVTATHIALLWTLGPPSAIAPVRSEALHVQLVRIPSNESGSSRNPPSQAPDLQPARAAATAMSPPIRHAEAPAVSAQAEYRSAEILSQRPAALSPIEIPYPDVDAGGPGTVTTVVLTLYINERGIVDFIELDDPSAAGPFAAAVRRAFERAAFEPARDGMQPVKSRMQIQVSFESDDLNLHDPS